MVRPLSDFDSSWSVRIHRVCVVESHVWYGALGVADTDLDGRNTYCNRGNRTDRCSSEYLQRCQKVDLGIPCVTDDLIGGGIDALLGNNSPRNLRAGIRISCRNWLWHLSSVSLQAARLGLPLKDCNPHLQLAIRSLLLALDAVYVKLCPPPSWLLRPQSRPFQAAKLTATRPISSWVPRSLIVNLFLGQSVKQGALQQSCS